LKSLVVAENGMSSRDFIEFLLSVLS